MDHRGQCIKILCFALDQQVKEHGLLKGDNYETINYLCLNDFYCRYRGQCVC